MTLITSLVAELRPRALHRIREQDFYSIHVDFDLNGAPHVTSTDCPIPLSLDTALRLGRCEDPTWWPKIVGLATNLLRDGSDDDSSDDGDDPVSGEGRLRPLGTETEWSLKLWYALDGEYTAADAVLGLRKLEEWEEKFALFVHASVCTALADECECPARREIIPTHSARWTRNARSRRAIVGPLMREHAPGLASYISRSGRGALDDPMARGLHESQQELMKQTREHLGRRGELILGRMENWVADHPDYVFSEDDPDVLDDTYDLDAVELNTDEVFSGTTCRLRRNNTDILDTDSRPSDAACGQPAEAKDDPVIYPGGLVRPVPLRPWQAHCPISTNKR